MRRRDDALAPAAVLAMLLVGAAAVGRTAAQKSPEVPALFLFGDSVIDTGTNDYIPTNIQANIQPYGETFFHSPTGRWSDGRLIFDFIAEYLKLPFPEPFLKPGAKFATGACLASGGSGILDSTGLGVISLSQQVQQFEQLVTELKKDLGNDTADHIVSKSLYAFASGSNDFTTYVSNATLQQEITPGDLIGMLIAKLETDILTVIAMGAQKIVVVGQGPGGYAPAVLASTTSAGVSHVNQIEVAFNSALLGLVTGINAKMNATVLVLGNRYNTTLDLILNGASQGFTEGETGCCGNGPFNGIAYRCGRENNYTVCSDVSKYVHWDFVHSTERVNRIIADNMWNGNASYIQPLNIYELSCL